MKLSWIFVCLLLFLSATIYALEPIAHYTFDEGAEDVTGNGFDGTFTSDAYVEDGFLMLDGDDDAVEIPLIGTFNELTYAMWAYSTVDLVPLQFSGGINTHVWTSGSVHFKLNYGLLNVGIYDFGPDVVGFTEVWPEDWHHIALTVSDIEIALYLDGLLETVAEVTTPLNLILGDAMIGAWNNGGTLEREWTGMMDDVRIYDVALSEEEIDSLYKILPGISAVSDKETDNVPETFNLSQNYPNPFNPTTTIAYSLKSNDKVRLSVYDLVGNEVAVLIDGIQSAGNHEVQFEGANLASGIYFYKLQTEEQVITRKMMFVK